MIIPLLLLFPALILTGQNTNFKSRTRYPSGTIKPAFEFITVNRQAESKSDPASTTAVSPPLERPLLRGGLQKVDKVIRKDGKPVYIERKTEPSKSEQDSPPEEKLSRFLEDTRTISRINNLKEQFAVTQIRNDRNGITHLKAIQRYRGINIYGSEATFHLSADRERFTGMFHNIDNEIDTNPSVSQGSAVSKVKSDLMLRTVVRELSAGEKKLLKYESPETGLVIYNNTGNDYRLAWEVTCRPNAVEVWKYFIDAQNGSIIHSFNATCTDGPETATALDLNNISRTINTYLEKGTYYMLNIAEPMFNPSTGEGMIITLDANNTSTTELDYRYVTSATNTWNNKAAVSAHYNATRAYEYFLQTHGHNSVNGKGGNIISFINVAEDDGSSMENAFWNGQAAFYGNGGKYFKPLAGALDVTAHELGHGVVSNTANLEYYGQPGAINETYADIFGSMVDRDDWLIGEDITRTTFSPSGALRNMADPHNMGKEGDPYWQPKHVAEMYLGKEDNAGVHINNGIGIHAYYLYAAAVSKDKAEKVFFHALDNYLTKTSRFIDFRIAVIQSASDLFGTGSAEVAEAVKAFDSVGIYEEEVVQPNTEYEVNPGTEFILFCNTDPNYRTTLALFNGSQLSSLSETEMKNNPSVTDNGAEAVFVTADSKIRHISLNPVEPEEIISNQEFWDNVAISKDGKRLAAISTQVDTSIYVYDFTSRKWAKFRLYNPTTSHFNTDAGGVIYADAIEFDISGENLIYDACNVLSSNVTEDIYYWDIGVIKVWDKSGSKFGDGSIFKLYGSLPEGISIGNPTFSRNSSSVIAFDYIDGNSGNYAILGTDLNTGETDVIAENSTLGFPSFSKNDDRIAYSALTTSDVEVVAGINLAPNKISGSGNPFAMINNARWPVYFATGERDLGLAPVSDFTADYKTGDSPLEVRYVDLSVNNPASWKWTFEGGVPATSTKQNPYVVYNTPGTFRVSLETRNEFGVNAITREDYITVNIPTGISGTNAVEFRVYPNPAGELLNIDCGTEFSFRIFDLKGKPIKTGINERQISLSGIDPGFYILEMTSGNVVSRQKLLVK